MTEKSWSASFAGTDRYTPPKDSGQITVNVDGVSLPAVVLGRNGPRVQVRFTRDGSTFVRWFNSSDLKALETEPPAAS